MRRHQIEEKVAIWTLRIAALVSIATTIAIIATLMRESISFFSEVSVCVKTHSLAGPRGQGSTSRLWVLRSQNTALGDLIEPLRRKRGTRFGERYYVPVHGGHSGGPTLRSRGVV